MKKNDVNVIGVKRVVAMFLAFAMLLSTCSYDGIGRVVSKASSTKTLIVGASSRAMIAKSKKKVIYTYRSSKPKVASVSKNGVVTGKKKGTVSIIRYKTKKKKTKIDKVQVFKVKKLSVSGNATVYTGGSYQYESNATGVTWKLSSSKIAKLSANGVLTPLSEGSVTITAKKGKKAKVTKSVSILPDALDRIESVYAGNSVNTASLDKSQLRVYAIYKSGNRKEVTDYNLAENSNTAGDKEFQITYGTCSVRLVIPKSSSNEEIKAVSDKTTEQDAAINEKKNQDNSNTTEGELPYDIATTTEKVDSTEVNDKTIATVETGYVDQCVYEGEGIDLSKIKLEITYQDGTKAYVSPSSLRLGDSYSDGENCYSVIYYTVDGVEYQTMISVKEKASKPIELKVESAPEYMYVGNKLDPDAFVLKATYSDKTTKIVKGWTTDYTPANSEGKKTIRFEYEEDGVIVSTEKEMEIKAVTSTGIRIGKYITNLQQGETLNLASIEVFETFSDGSEKVVSGYSTDYDSSDRSSGVRTVTVSYQDYTTTFPLMIDSLKIVAIKATSPTAPTIKGSDLNEIGMSLTAVYEDGSESNVGGWTTDDVSGLDVGEHSVNVSYGGLNCSMNVVIEDPLSFKEYSSAVVVKHPIEVITNKSGLTWHLKEGNAEVAVNGNVVTVTPTAVGPIKVVVMRQSTNENAEINLNAEAFKMTYLNTAGGNVAKGDKIKLTSNAPAQFSWTVDGDDGFFEGSSSTGLMEYSFAANRIGNLTMVAKDSISGETYTKTVVVRKELEISGSSSVNKGSSITLTTTKNVVVWSSSNSAVATVTQGGKVTGKKAGTVTITAKFPEYGDRKVTKKITVK